MKRSIDCKPFPLADDKGDAAPPRTSSADCPVLSPPLSSSPSTASNHSPPSHAKPVVDFPLVAAAYSPDGATGRPAASGSLGVPTPESSPVVSSPTPGTGNTLPSIYSAYCGPCPPLATRIFPLDVCDSLAYGSHHYQSGQLLLKSNEMTKACSDGDGKAKMYL